MRTTTTQTSDIVGQLVLVGRCQPDRPEGQAGHRLATPARHSRRSGWILRQWIALSTICGFYRYCDHALACLLALNGLRISEALTADIENLDASRGHRTLFIHRKGHKTATIPLSPRTARALDLYIGERETGPVFSNHDGTRRLDRYATYIVSTFAVGASR